MSDRTRELSFSSDQTIVQRWYGGEILDHSLGSIRMDFINSGRAPLLQYHDSRAVIGVIESASVDGGIGRARARFGRTASAIDAMQNVDDGISLNTSVGYRMHGMRLESERNGEPVYRVIDWEPLEISQVAVPADPVVGFGRHVHLSPEIPELPEFRTESAEAARSQTIRELCRLFKIDRRAEQQWIDNGTRVAESAAEIAEVVKMRRGLR